MSLLKIWEFLAATTDHLAGETNAKDVSLTLIFFPFVSV